MTFKIVTADERLAKPSNVNIALFGPSGVGKTFQARTLPADKTLFIDYEAGTLALQDWRGDVLDVRQTANAVAVDPWELSRGLACLMAGPDPTDLTGPYSRKAYEAYASRLAKPEAFDKYEIVYVDSITVASRLAFAWAQRQPEAFSANGKPDKRAAYGLLGQEMVRWLTTIQHIARKSTVVVAILDRHVDDLGRVTWEPQIEGGKTARELPGIFDQVLTLQNFTGENGEAFRAFVTQQNNPQGYPAKDRSGRLAALEPPDLGALIRKIQSSNLISTPIDTTIPAPRAKTKEAQ